MRISRVRVENHSRLSDFELAVRNHLVLVGANEAGKSSLLRCLDLLLDASAAKIYANITKSDFKDPAQPLLIECEFIEFADKDRTLYPDEITVDPITGKEFLIVRLTSVLDSSEVLTVNRSAPLGGTGRQLSREQVLGLGWRFLSASSQSRDMRADRKSALNEILESVDLGTERVNFESIAESLLEELAQSSVLDQLRSDLADQLSKALPEPVGKGDLALVPGATSTDDVLSDVRLQILKGGVHKDLTEQSDGMRAMFAIAFYDLQSGGANVLGIDEPEEHLHPSSQRSLARLLKGRPNQKVIATHSSDIVSAFDPEDVVVIRNRGSVVQPQKGFLSQNEKLAVNWWVRGRLEPLTSRQIIVVEGNSDRIIVERVAEVTGRDLDRLGISLVDAGGKNSIPAVEKLFGPNGFNVPIFELIDEDYEAATALRLSVLKGDLPGKSVWVSRVDLEDEYVRAISPQVLWSALTASSIFSANQLSRCTPSGPSSTYSQSDVAKFCRAYKVEAAIVVSNLLDSVTARSISSVENLLSDVESHH